ncbi:MAG: putative cytosol aminopeptidase [Chlamydiales bacterium]|nr:putative cytosol aminopeptidase [Chlamydiales bacterium]
MIFSAISSLTKRKGADLIVLPFWRTQKKAKPAAVLGAPLTTLTKSPVEMGDFSGRQGETLLLYSNKGQKEKRCLLVGLGREEKLTVEGLRQAYSNVAKLCQCRGIAKINLVVPTVTQLRGVDVDGCLTGIAEGILLTNYSWEKLATLEEETVLLKSVALIGVLPKDLSVVRHCAETAEGVHFARDLINGNADLITPHYLGEAAKKIAKKFPNTTAHVHDRKWIEKEKMGLLLAVSRGSAHDPVFIVLSYKGHPRSKDHTVLIGKGVTYDTGGLNLKPTGSMETMREDMSGAATALATVATAASLKLERNVTAVVAATENGIDALSYKPGDVYVGMSGMTVEIGNTDAEGRLTLADALTYSLKKLKPSRMIDLATLTGSMVMALGEGMSGLFCNDEKLTDQLLQASHHTSEILWRMPLHHPYKEMLKSDIADIRNIGGRPAGAITAALFLQEFVEKTPWAHIDIAGTAFQSKERGYWPKNGVGFGVRLLVDFLQNLKND